MLLVLLTIATMCAMLALAWYHRLPDDGRCPRCGARVESADRGTGVWRRWPLRRLVGGARCPTCGWGGPMRPGPAAETARAERREGREES